MIAVMQRENEYSRLAVDGKRAYSSTLRTPSGGVRAPRTLQAVLSATRQPGGGVTPVIRSGPSVYQTSHGVQAGRGAAGGIGSVECQAVATLYMLLIDHPIDRRGRYRSCRRPGAVFGPRWRRCWVFGNANMWLHQLDEALLARLLVHELGLATAPRPATGVASGRASASDPNDTDMLPAIAADRPTEPLQTPAVPPTPTAEAGWPDLAHGRAGDDPESPQPRRVPSDNPILPIVSPLCCQEVQHGRLDRRRG